MAYLVGQAFGVSWACRIFRYEVFPGSTVVLTFLKSMAFTAHSLRNQSNRFDLKARPDSFDLADVGPRGQLDFGKRQAARGFGVAFWSLG